MDFFLAFVFLFDRWSSYVGDIDNNGSLKFEHTISCISSNGLAYCKQQQFFPYLPMCLIDTLYLCPTQIHTFFLSPYLPTLIPMYLIDTLYLFPTQIHTIFLSTYLPTYLTFFSMFALVYLSFSFPLYRSLTSLNFTLRHTWTPPSLFSSVTHLYSLTMT